MATLYIDESVKKLGPILEGKTETKGAHLVPQPAHGMVFFQRLLKERTTMLLELVDEKGQHRQVGKDAGQILVSVSIVVFEIVALVFERIEGFIFNFPTGTTSSHEGIDGVGGQT